jgi:protein SCO1/2
MFIARITFCCLLVVTLAGCQTPERPCCQKMQKATAGDDTLPHATNSIYDLSAVWQDDQGRNFRLSELRGHPVVISMFFATCEGVCLITRDDMKTIESSAPAAVRNRTTFVLITLDPDHDTATELQDYRVAQGLSPERWRLLRGSNADTARLATMLGIGYGLDRSGLFRHSSTIIVLDDSGKIVSWQDGVHADLTKPVQTLARLNRVRRQSASVR